MVKTRPIPLKASQQPSSIHTVEINQLMLRNFLIVMKSQLNRGCFLRCPGFVRDKNSCARAAISVSSQDASPEERSHCQDLADDVFVWVCALKFCSRI
jgi:hypothetical protein